MAGVGFQLAAVGSGTPGGEFELDARVAKVRSEIQTAIGDVRRLVEGLRPPALDELGLAGAVARQAAIFGGGPSERSPNPGLSVVTEVAPDLPRLAPAVEVAAFRIVSEALTNIARHADASSCTVRIWADASLHLLVADDGRGIPRDHHRGVGLRSMRERALEVGGDLSVESCPGEGTWVRAQFPLDCS